jgi:hypothetical protein
MGGRRNGVRRLWTGFNCFRIRTGDGFCEHGNERSTCIEDYVTCGENASVWIHISSRWKITWGADWIQLAQDTVQWRDFVNSVMHLLKRKILKLSPCFFNWAPHHEGVLESAVIAPLILWPRNYMEVSGQLQVPAALPPEKEPLVPIGWTPEPFWRRWRRENFLAPAGNRTLEPRSSSPEPSRYTHWALTALGNEPSGSIKAEDFWVIWVTMRFPKRTLPHSQCISLIWNYLTLGEHTSEWIWNFGYSYVILLHVEPRLRIRGVILPLPIRLHGV